MDDHGFLLLLPRSIRFLLSCVIPQLCNTRLSSSSRSTHTQIKWIEQFESNHGVTIFRLALFVIHSIRTNISSTIFLSSALLSDLNLCIECVLYSSPFGSYANGLGPVSPSNATILKAAFISIWSIYFYVHFPLLRHFLRSHNFFFSNTIIPTFFRFFLVALFVFLFYPYFFHRLSSVRCFPFSFLRFQSADANAISHFICWRSTVRKTIENRRGRTVRCYPQNSQKQCTPHTIKHP